MSEHTLPLKNFFWDECHCEDVEYQTYSNTVGMKAPFDLSHRDDGWVTIDTCIATEIGYLWNNGVITLGSCCGHQKTDANVVVHPESYKAMEEIGYSDYADAPNGVRIYLLKTGHSGTNEEWLERIESDE